ncbi:GntR family transcriptional regulator [Parablautia intestinalis]|jgi:GntR family transcriptional regulator|uniref:GntR family transcriptional regulator n=1 Tax=Parablautia intestinalis TaxID=2320100 RepID=UPI0023C92C26|nr:GntR family transcriptional regulator [Parablautia intestinalis]MCI8615935.1 GntR family transcriptional regulator [Lachnospiraceae bacterium]MDE7047927.1 GntR family transcriptional regulator [Lachnospiraceae bacterium]
MTNAISFITIDKHNQVPLYFQVKESILSAIRSGKFLPGDKLPTEEELCKEFGISRPVVRQAYSELTAEHIIERKRGHGSYVKQMDIANMSFHQLINFEEEMKILGKKPGTQLIRAEVVPYDTDIYQSLDMEKEDPCFMIVRVRYADCMPFSLISNYISLARFPGLDRFDFAVESLYRTLEGHYHTKIYKANRTMHSQIIDPTAANLLRVEKQTAAHIVTSVDFDCLDKPVGMSVEVFPGETHEFSFTVYRR